MNEPGHKPSLAWYLLPLCLFLGGGAGIVYCVSQATSTFRDSFQQFIVPGRGGVTLPETGRYTIYYEYQSTLDGRTFSTGEDLPDGLECVITAADTETHIPISETTTSAKYTLGSRKGYALWTFSIDRPGEYVYSCTHRAVDAGPEVVLAVVPGLGFYSKAVIMILLAIWLLFVTVGLALTAAVVIFVLRLSRQPPADGLPPAVSRDIPEESGTGDHNWEVFCHLASLSAFVGVPFGHLLGPLVVWLLGRKESSSVDDQGKESLNFQVSMTLYSLVLFISIIGIPFSFILVALNVILVILATIRAGKGELYRYPLTFRIIK